MTDFLMRLLERSIDGQADVRPRLPARFEEPFVELTEAASAPGSGSVRGRPEAQPRYPGDRPGEDVRVRVDGGSTQRVAPSGSMLPETLEPASARLRNPAVAEPESSGPVRAPKPGTAAPAASPDQPALVSEPATVRPIGALAAVARALVPQTGPSNTVQGGSTAPQSFPPAIGVGSSAPPPSMRPRVSPRPVLVPAPQPPLPERPIAEVQPTVRVNIGRVEVRAVFSAAPRRAPVPPKREPPRPSLEEYLRGGDAKRG